jgi:hypothetical protein
LFGKREWWDRQCSYFGVDETCSKEERLPNSKGVRYAPPHIPISPLSPLSPSCHLSPYRLLLPLPFPYLPLLPFIFPYPHKGIAQPIHSTEKIWKRALLLKEAFDAEIITVDQTTLHTQLQDLCDSAAGVAGEEGERGRGEEGGERG